MYRHIAFKEVSENFTAHFGLSISPFYDRSSSNASGQLVFIAHKFVKWLMINRGYEGSASEALSQFIGRRYGPAAWKFLKKLTK